MTDIGAVANNPESKTGDALCKVLNEAYRFLDRAIEFSMSCAVNRRGVALIVDYFSHAFNVQSDEVALLVLDLKGRNLRFVAPEHLAVMSAGFPFDSLRSLAGKSLYFRRPLIENRLSQVNHLCVFERAKQKKGTPLRIEKMITFPILNGNHPVGVVQISRKKRIPGFAPPDFTERDLCPLREVENAVLRLFQGVRSCERNSMEPLTAAESR